MRPLEIDKQTTLNHILNELKTGTDGLELTGVPNEKTVLDNPINRRVIEKVAKQFKKEVAFPTITEETLSPPSDDLGFVEGEDVMSKIPMEEVTKVTQPLASTTPPTIQGTKKIPKFSIPEIFKRKTSLLIAGVVILGALLVIGGFTLPSSQVTLTLTAQEKEAEVSLVADSKLTDADPEGQKIAFTVREITKEGSDEMPTTTKKTVGTLASGRVTITNRDTVEKQYLKGTVLTSVGSTALTFKLDETVAIQAPAFGEEEKVGVGVTATTAGEASNLVANTSFKVGSEVSPLVFAKNDLAFSGGSTKQVTVATSSDRESLKTTIVNKLTGEAEEELAEGESETLIAEGGLDTSVTKETYTPKDVDAEAEELKATISVKTVATLIKKEDLLAILVKNLEEKEEGFKVDEENSVVSATVLTKNPDGTLALNAKISAKLVPTVSEEEIIANIKGKGISDVGKYLNSLENISGYKVDTTPAPFRILGRMPFLESKIKVNFENE